MTERSSDTQTSPFSAAGRAVTILGVASPEQPDVSTSLRIGSRQLGGETNRTVVESAILKEES